MPTHTMTEALNLALHEAMAADDGVVVLGAPMGRGAGRLRPNRGLRERFGAGRVIEAHLEATAIVGSAIGMAIAGLKPVCELPFSKLTGAILRQLEARAARMDDRGSGRGRFSLVIRVPYTPGLLQSTDVSGDDAWLAHASRLKVAIASSPATARELLRSAIRDPAPVIVFEPEALHHRGPEPLSATLEDPNPLGRGRRLREGADITLLTYGAMIPRALAAADALARDGIEADVLDLLSLTPLDDELIAESVIKTGHAVIVHEARCGFGANSEIVARLYEHCLFHLHAPIARVTGFGTAVAPEPLAHPETLRIANAARRIVAEVAVAHG